MKVLVTTPLCVPSYFNAGHRLAMFEVAAYLRSQGHTVVAMDIASLNVTWKDLADLFIQNHFDAIALFNDFDLIEGFGRFVEYAQEFATNAPIVTFGRLSSAHPYLFYQYKIAGIVGTGDYEPGVAEFVKYVETGSDPAGVHLNNDGEWIEPQTTGILLSVDQWVLPKVNEIAYASYDALYSSDQRKFCGIPERRELVVPIARGCPVQCNFCEVWQREGLIERRLPVADVISYIEESFTAEPFEYVSMYAPTFTLKKKWVRDLCAEFIRLGNKYPWKCTTTMFHLDEDLVKLMGEAGCFRISVGLESMEDAGLEDLPIHKHNAFAKFNELLGWCNAAGIELNCFVIVGLPGTTVEGTRKMFDYLRENKVRVRPSIFSDYSLLKEGMSEADALRILSRHIIPQNTGFSDSERAELYKIVFGVERNLTQVMTSIPKRNK